MMVLGRGGGEGVKGRDREEKEGTNTGGREGGGEWEEGLGEEKVVEGRAGKNGEGGKGGKTRKKW